MGFTFEKEIFRSCSFSKGDPSRSDYDMSTETSVYDLIYLRMKLHSFTYKGFISLKIALWLKPGFQCTATTGDYRRQVCLPQSRHIGNTLPVMVAGSCRFIGNTLHAVAHRTRKQMSCDHLPQSDFSFSSRLIFQVASTHALRPMEGL